jgi:hypothetical protein
MFAGSSAGDHASFAAIAERAGLPVNRLHDVRHSCATTALDAGVPVKSCRRGSHTGVLPTAQGPP